MQNVPVSSRPGPVVLLVEDDDDLRQLTCHMLEQRGYQPLAAKDAVSAITTCRLYEGEIDVLLTDLGLPGVSGAELARSAAAARPHMEIVYVSGIPQHVAVKQGLVKAGAPFVAKPFTADRLIGSLRAVLARHSYIPSP